MQTSPQRITSLHDFRIQIPAPDLNLAPFFNEVKTRLDTVDMRYHFLINATDMADRSAPSGDHLHGITLPTLDKVIRDKHRSNGFAMGKMFANQGSVLLIDNPEDNRVISMQMVSDFFGIAAQNPDLAAEAQDYITKTGLPQPRPYADAVAAWMDPIADSQQRAKDLTREEIVACQTFVQAKYGVTTLSQNRNDNIFSDVLKV